MEKTGKGVSFHAIWLQSEPEVSKELVDDEKMLTIW